MPPGAHMDNSPTTSKPLQVLAVVGSLRQRSHTRLVMREAARLLAAHQCAVDVLDFQAEPLPLYNPDTAHASPAFPALQRRVQAADVLLLGAPDYHGSISSVMKSFLDHFWKEFAGKLFASIVSSHEKGLTVTDQLRTVARQCYAWSLPYGVSFVSGEDVKNDEIVSGPLRERLAMFARDISVYGAAIARQRALDLACAEPGFMARHRPSTA
ncbi:MAG TPA: NAD(P)H-dependent oxidoreductase [Verrucomicrobiae bacterium]|nr:NAD(P)H-dependent oxidoreductase [Verrucomicrobiae bacterium]